MIKYIVIIFFLIINISSSFAENKIAYIDIGYILKESLVGQYINNHISDIENNNLNKFNIKETLLKNKEKQIIAQKNIIEKNELEQKLIALNDEIRKYRIEKKEIIEDLNKKKIEYTKKVLTFLNPIIKKYVEENSFSIVFPKKNIVVGKKDLDITNDVLNLLNNEIKTIEF